MESTYDTIGRLRLVVLNETNNSNLLIELPLGVRLKEIASGILEDTGFYDENTIYRRLNYIHILLFNILPRKSFPLLNRGELERVSGRVRKDLWVLSYNPNRGLS
jgi:hypothetical protein